MVYNYRGFSQGQGQAQAGEIKGGPRDLYEFIEEHSADYRGFGSPKLFKVGDRVLTNPKYDTADVVITTLNGKAPSDDDFEKAKYDAAILLSIPKNKLKVFTPQKGVIVHGGAGGKEKILDKVKENTKKTFGNPFASGFKKYVVTENFVAKGFSKEAIARGDRQLKRGMNLFAKEVPVSTTDGSIGTNLILVSFAGYIIDKTKVKLKNPNVYEKIQSFFTTKRGFA
jgi:hypothetical protein